RLGRLSLMFRIMPAENAAMATTQVYLSFNGTCEEAFRFYEQRLGATLGQMFPYANSPMAADAPPEWGAKIMHGSITLGGMTISAAYVSPGHHQPPQGVRLVLEADDADGADRMFEALAENAAIE